MSDSQDTKDINIKEIFHDQTLESIILSRLGAMDPISKRNALSQYEDTIRWFERLKRKYGKNFSILDEVILELRHQGNHKAIHQMDSQSQAIIKTAYKPTISEDE